MRVLVLGAGGNAAMNFVKCLRIADPNLFVVGTDISARFFDNPQLDVAVHLTDISNEIKIVKLNALINEFSIDVVHAQADSEVKFLCKFGKFLNAKVAPLSLKKWNKFADKYSCQRHWAESLGASFRCSRLEDALKQPKIFDELKKASGVVWMRAIQGAGSKGALPIKSIDQARMWAEYWNDKSGIPISDFMVAEFLSGPEYAVQTVWHKGVLISSQARERIEYVFQHIMPSGQSSTPSVAKIVNNPNVYDVAERAILAIDESPDGIYCVDLKANITDEIIPLEVNYGRFFTTSDFFANVGVNGPWTYLKSITGSQYTRQLRLVKKPFYWIRGLDREPYLAMETSGKLTRIKPSLVCDDHLFVQWPQKFAIQTLQVR